MFTVEMCISEMYLLLTNLILVLFCLPLSGDLGNGWAESSSFDISSSKSVPETRNIDEIKSSSKPQLYSSGNVISATKSDEFLGGSTLPTQILSDPTGKAPGIQSSTRHTRRPGEILETLLENGLNLSNSGDKESVPPIEVPDTASRSNIPEVSTIYRSFGHCRSCRPFSNIDILMVDSCPSSTMDMWLVSMCMTDDSSYRYSHSDCVIDISNIPVQDPAGVVYRNIYCSLCHGAQNASTWSAEIDTDAMTHLKVDENKNIIVLKEHGHKAPNCSKSLYPAQRDKLILCMENSWIKDSHSHRGRSSVGNGPNIKTSIFPLSFQVLMNFGINGKGHIFFSATSQTDSSVEVNKCDVSEIFDQHTGKCKKIVCAEGYELVNSKCQQRTGSFASNSPPDLDTLNQDAETSQVTLRLNVTDENLAVLELENTDKEIVKKLSEMLNISSDRIKNFTMEIRNGTASGKMIEVHTYVTPRPSRHFVKHKKPIVPLLPDDGFANGDSEQAYEVEGEQKESYGSESSSEEKNVDVTYTLVIKFIILPAKKKSSKDVPTSLVVAAMKSMIDGKSFSFSLNGTSFYVDGVDSDEDPLILDSWCTKGRINYHMGDEFDYDTRYNNETGEEESGVYVNSTKTFYGKNMFDLYVMLTTTVGEVSNINTSSYVFVCDMPRIVDSECGRIEIVDSEYTRYGNNSILYSDELLSMNEYEYVNDSLDSLRLCIPESYSSDSKEPENRLVHPCGEDFYNVILVENYLSFILGIISLIAMVTVLFTYCIFESLRNLPGINTINLTTALFLGELLFLISGLAVNEEIEWLCKAIAVSLHYVFLASFFWMNVMSYDLYRTFGNKCILTRVREKKRFFGRYFIYAWGSPALIVLVCSFIDFSRLFDGVHIGYGGVIDADAGNEIITSTPSNNGSNETNNSVVIKSEERYSSSLSKSNLGCWIMEPVATLVTFGLPMILILATNTVMFIRTIICIRAVAKLAHLKTRRSSLNHAMGKSDVMLYVRMSTVMGFTWVVGLASSIVSAFVNTATETMCVVLHAIGILFIILNCSQGVFIFVAFVFNKRVLGLYNAKIKAWRENKKQRPYLTSTSTLSSSLRY